MALERSKWLFHEAFDINSLALDKSIKLALKCGIEDLEKEEDEKKECSNISDMEYFLNGGILDAIRLRWLISQSIYFTLNPKYSKFELTKDEVKAIKFLATVFNEYF